MDRTAAVGVGLLVAGLGGYAAGVYVAYPGRSLSVTAVMVGVSLVALGREPNATSAGDREGQA